MSDSIFAVIPVMVESWSKTDNLSADCLNELHSKDKTPLGSLDIGRLNSYQHNELRLKRTDDRDLSAAQLEAVNSVRVVVIDVNYFKQRNYCVDIGDNVITIRHLTARKLLEIVSGIHEKVLSA